MKKSLIVSLSLVTLLSSARAASAYQGNPNVMGPNYNPERHEAMEATFVAGEKGYENWLKLMENRAWRLRQVVTSSKIFAEFAQAHEKGVESMNTFRAKYNLGPNGQGFRAGRNR